MGGVMSLRYSAEFPWRDYYALVLRDTTASTASPIPYDGTVVYNYGATKWYSSGANTKMTVPAGVTLARYAAQADKVSGSGTVNIRLLKNGAGYYGGGRKHNGGLTSAYTGGAYGAPIAVTAGDEFTTQNASTVGGASDSTWVFAEALDPTTKYAVVYNSVSQSLPTGVVTTLTFDSEFVDTDGFHSTASNTERLSVPSGSGITRVRLIGNICLDVANRTGISLQKNGSAFTGGFYLFGTGALRFIGTSPVLDVVAGTDWFRMVDNNIGARNTDAASTWFSIEEVPDYDRIFLTLPANSAAGAVAWGVGSTVYDYTIGGVHSETVDNTKIFVPVGYSEARVAANLASSANFRMRLLKNGVEFDGMIEETSDNNGVTTTVSRGCNGATGWLPVAGGTDYFTLDSNATALAGGSSWINVEFR